MTNNAIAHIQQQYAAHHPQCNTFALDKPKSAAYGYTAVFIAFVAHNFPLFSIMLQFVFKSVIGLIVITPSTPATIIFNIYLAIPFSVCLPEICFSIFGPRRTISTQVFYSVNYPTSASIKSFNIIVFF